MIEKQYHFTQKFLDLIPEGTTHIITGSLGFYLLGKTENVSIDVEDYGSSIKDIIDFNKPSLLSKKAIVSIKNKTYVARPDFDFDKSIMAIGNHRGYPSSSGNFQFENEKGEVLLFLRLNPFLKE